MTRDDVIRLAREAGFRILVEPEIEWIERLIEMAQAEEREACAAIIQDAATAAANNNDLRGYELLSALGRAVRARGQK